MPEDITAQILAQTAENIQKLYDLSTRIDERVKIIQSNYKDLEKVIESIQVSHSLIVQKVAVLESKDVGILQNEVKKEINALEKRIISFEAKSDENKDRWNKIFTFIIQIIWVVLVAWLLMKLGLQSPP